MKIGFLAALLLIFLVLFTYNVLSHAEDYGEEYNLDNSELYPISQFKTFGYGSLIFGILILIIILFHRKMDNTAKKVVYTLVVIIVTLVTLYLVATTVHLNFISKTKGPVHWHADYEIWVCGEKIHLMDPDGFSNRVGTPLLHEHDDNRIHIEGVIVNKRDVSLGAYFRSVGGSLSSDGMQVPTNEGLVSAHDGNKCNGQPAKMYVFVNGELMENPSAHVPAPYERVPPGDMIKIVFTEQPIESINQNIG